MFVRHKPGVRWLPVRIGDFGKWQASLLEESAKRLGAVLPPSGRARAALDLAYHESQKRRLPEQWC